MKASNTGGSFGGSVAVGGQQVIIGAAGEDSAATGINGDDQDTNAPSSGAVFVFE
jgi:hypothetical protein